MYTSGTLCLNKPLNLLGRILESLLDNSKSIIELLKHIFIAFK